MDGAARHDPAGAGRRTGRVRCLERRLAPTAPRPTRSPPSAATRSRAPASRSRAPTSTSAWSRAPATGVSRAEDARDRAAGAARALVRRCRTAAGSAKPELLRMVALRDRRPAAHARSSADATTWSSAATPSSTSPKRSATRCTRGSSTRWPRAATSSSARPSASRDPRRARPHVPVPLHLPEELNGRLRVPPDVPGRGPRAPPGAQPRGRADRGDARRPGDGRRDLPHRALAEGHERDDGLRRHGRAHARDGGRLRAPAPARAAASSARRSTCCSSAWTRCPPRSTRSTTDGAEDDRAASR